MTTDQEIEEFEMELEEQRSRNYEFWCDYLRENYLREKDEWRELDDD